MAKTIKTNKEKIYKSWNKRQSQKEKAQDQRSQSMKEQDYNKDKDQEQESRTQWADTKPYAPLVLSKTKRILFGADKKTKRTLGAVFKTRFSLGAVFKTKRTLLGRCCSGGGGCRDDDAWRGGDGDGVMWCVAWWRWCGGCDGVDEVWSPEFGRK
ncbi:hypothetical protein Tco_0343180 [Tanacetum coccineum]